MENKMLMNENDLETVAGGAAGSNGNGADTTMLGRTVTLIYGADYYEDSYKGGNHGTWNQANPYVQSHNINMVFRVSRVVTASQWQTAPYHLVDAANSNNALGWVELASIVVV